MNKKGVIILFIFLGFIAVFFYVPYIVFHDESLYHYKDNQLIDYWKNDRIEIKVMLLALFFPIPLIIESTVWNSRKVLWKRFLLLLQGILVFSGGFFIWFVMTFHLFTGPYDYRFVFYLIMIYLSIGIVWNVLLAIPFFDNNKQLSNSFKALSLRKKNTLQVN